VASTAVRSATTTTVEQHRVGRRSSQECGTRVGRGCTQESAATTAALLSIRTPLAAAAETAFMLLHSHEGGGMTCVRWTVAERVKQLLR
jgi:hypothetical protein